MKKGKRMGGAESGSGARKLYYLNIQIFKIGSSRICVVLPVLALDTRYAHSVARLDIRKYNFLL